MRRFRHLLFVLVTPCLIPALNAGTIATADADVFKRQDCIPPLTAHVSGVTQASATLDVVCGGQGGPIIHL